MNDAGLDPCVFRLGRMQRKNRRTASAAKAPLNLPAAAAHEPVALHLRRCLHLQIFPIDPDSDIESAAVRTPAILAVAIIGRAEFARISQSDSATQTRGFEILSHHVRSALLVAIGDRR